MNSIDIMDIINCARVLSSIIDRIINSRRKIESENRRRQQEEEKLKNENEPKMTGDNIKKNTVRARFPCQWPSQQHTA